MLIVLLIIALLVGGYALFFFGAAIHDLGVSARLLVKITEQTRVANSFHYEQFRDRFDRLMDNLDRISK